jgi:hypothetical protein
MPVFNFIQWSQDQGGWLTKDGPVIQVEISMPTALEAWCVQNHVPIPAPVSGYALIDTGASISGIHQPILDQLSLTPIDEIPIVTPAGAGRTPVYPTKVSFPSLNVKNQSLSRVVGSQLDWKTSQGERIVMLLGRDLLHNGIFVYNSSFNHFAIAY